MNTKLNTIKLLSALALLVFGLNANAQLQTQIHVHSDGGDNPNGLKSTIGHQNIAEGNYSLAAGWGNRSKGQTSFAIGYYNLAEGLNTIAMGMYTKSQSAHSITIGNGYSFAKPLLNNTEGMMLGMGSNLPTLFISPCSENRTGKVAIGNCTVPQSKLHIKADNDEDAAITLEPVQNKDASIMFRNKEIFIKVEKSGKMSITVPSKPIVFSASKYCFGTERIYMKNEGTDDFSVFVPKTMSMEALQIRFSGNDAINMNSQRITMNGKVGINIENYQDDYSLAVNGGIITTEVYIAEADNWPDHVFADDYKLMGLHELENFIRANRHLPEVPSEEEVLENGYDMGEMQQTLLKKIEELTLYTIQLQQQIERQQKEIDELKAK